MSHHEVLRFQFIWLLFLLASFLLIGTCWSSSNSWSSLWKIFFYYLSQLTLKDFIIQLLGTQSKTFWQASCSYIVVIRFSFGPGSSVGIATDYGLDGPESNPGGDKIFRPYRTALGPTQPPVKWVPGLYRGRVRLGGAADHSPPSSAAVMEE
jgi:hypothetical protein